MDEAIETLASPDVTVTNQSDKELQLYKLREFAHCRRLTVAAITNGDLAAHRYHAAIYTFNLHRH